MHIELLNRQVQFKVCDIHFPKPEAVMDQLYKNRVLEGRVLEVTESDAGVEFAVIAVSEIQTPVIVRADRIGISNANAKGEEA